MRVCSAFEYYFTKLAGGLRGRTFQEFLRQLGGVRVVVLDYCGMPRRYAAQLRASGAAILLMDGPNEKAEGVTDEADLVLAACRDCPAVPVDVPHLRIVFERGHLAKIVPEYGREWR